MPRRRVLGASAAVGLGLGFSGLRGEAATSPASKRPTEGDLLVFRFGDRAGQTIKAEDVVGTEIVQAVSKDPASGVIRDGSRLNGINLVRIEPATLDAETRDNAAGEVVAYSSVCTHQGCDLTQFWPEKKLFECYCHHSQFDVARNGDVTHGPAQRRLAMLPIKVSASGELVVAGPFSGRVGFK